MDAKLKHSTAWRGGASGHVLDRTSDSGRIEIHPSWRRKAEGPGFELRLDMPSKGGGTTHVRAVIGEADYQHVLEAMAETSRHATLRAIAAILPKNLRAVLKDG